MALDEVTAARYIPILQGEVRRQKARIEDLEHDLNLLRQHTAACPRCEQVEDHDRDKAASNV